MAARLPYMRNGKVEAACFI